MPRYSPDEDEILVIEVVEVEDTPSSRFATHLASQFTLLVMIALGAVVIFISGLLWPDFFNYPYLALSPTFVSDVMRFLPFFGWAVILGLLAVFFNDLCASEFDEEILIGDLIISIGAGITEEAWFRGVGIFFAMVMLIVSNFVLSMFSWVFVLLSLFAMAFTIISLFARGVTFTGIVGRIFGFGASIALIYALVMFNPDPLYMMYEKIFYPIIDFTTFGMMRPVLYGSHDTFFVMGAISANFAFRDGHKYQGVFGWSNAWFGGCVFLFATLSYGLWVGMAVHALANSIIHSVVYVGRKIRG